MSQTYRCPECGKEETINGHVSSRLTCAGGFLSRHEETTMKKKSGWW